jgi:hypothetical protein
MPPDTNCGEESTRSLSELDISTPMSNNLQSELAQPLDEEEHEGKMQHNCFS